MRRHDVFDIPLPLDIHKIYNFSCEQINKNFEKSGYSLPVDILVNNSISKLSNGSYLLEDKSEPEYRQRIKDAILDIKSKFPGKNILIVTHGDAVTSFLYPKLRTHGLEYSEVIVDPLFPDSYKNKYLKNGQTIFKGKYIKYIHDSERINQLDDIFFKRKYIKYIHDSKRINQLDDIFFKEKYIKYKTKYLQLKNRIQ